MSAILRRKLLRDAWRMRARIVLLAIVVVVGTGMSITLFQSYANLRDSYDSMYEDNGLAHVFITLDRPRQAPDNPTAAFASRGMQSVDHAEARLSLEGSIDAGGEERKALLVGMPRHAWPEINDICVLDGDFAGKDYACARGEKAKRGIQPLGSLDGVYLHAGFAEIHGIERGDVLSVLVGDQEEEFRVAGFALNSEFLLTTANPELLVPEPGSLAVVWAPQERLDAIAHRLGFGDGPMANEVFLRMTPGHEADKAERARDVFLDQPERFADLHVRTLLVREDTVGFQLAEGDVEGFRQMTPIVAGIVMVVAFATVAITMERLVRGQQAIIGGLRALGVSRTSLTSHYVSFALIIGLVGAVAGAGVGIWGARAMSVWYREIIGFPVLHLGLGLPAVLGLAGAAVAASTAGGLRAALRASNTSITTAMRPSEKGAPSKALRGVTSRLGLVPRLAVRNLTRAKRRTAFTVFGITMSMVLTFAMGGMIDSVLVLVDEQFEREQWDVAVGVSPPQPEAALRADLQGVSWVQDVETYVNVPAFIDGLDTPVLLRGVEPDSMHRLTSVSGEDDVGVADGALVTESFVRQYERDTGDALRTGGGLDLIVDDQVHRVRVVGVVEELLGSNIYLPKQTVQDFVGAPVATGAYAKVAAGRTADKADLTVVRGFTDMSEQRVLRETLADSMDEIVQFAGLFAVVGAVLGLVVALNTSAVNLQERETEHGTLKALGLADRSLVAVLAAEGLFIGVVAAGVGSGLGALATITLLDVVTEEQAFVLPYAMPWEHVALISAAVILIAQAPTLFARRALRRIDLPQIIKQRGT